MHEALGVGEVVLVVALGLLLGWAAGGGRLGLGRVRCAAASTT